MTVKKSIPGAVALASMLAVPAVSIAAASAPAPKFSSDLIVPNKSLGGLTLNAPAASAKKIFGSKACSSTGSCSYETTDATLSLVTYQKTRHSKPLIGEISVSAVPGRSDPFTALQSARGIGLGSSYAAVKKAYPNAKKFGPGELEIKGHGTFETNFQFAGGKVTRIGMASVQFG
jgi:hypothetical protein